MKNHRRGLKSVRPKNKIYDQILKDMILVTNQNEVRSLPLTKNVQT